MTFLVYPLLAIHVSGATVLYPTPKAATALIGTDFGPHHPRLIGGVMVGWDWCVRDDAGCVVDHAMLPALEKKPRAKASQRPRRAAKSGWLGIAIQRQNLEDPPVRKRVLIRGWIDPYDGPSYRRGERSWKRHRATQWRTSP